MYNIWLQLLYLTVTYLVLVYNWYSIFSKIELLFIHNKKCQMILCLYIVRAYVVLLFNTEFMVFKTESAIYVQVFV